MHLYHHKSNLLNKIEFAPGINSQGVPRLFAMQVGDGTTTVVLLAGEFLKEAKPFIEEGVHSQNLIRSFRTAANLVCVLLIQWF